MNPLHAHGSPSGYQYKRRGCRCAPCRAVQSTKNSAYRAAHRKELSASHAAYNAAHHAEKIVRDRAYKAAHREENRVSCRDYRAAHREEMRIYDAAYNADHRDERRAYMTTYRRANPDQTSIGSRNRRARVRGAVGSHTPTDVAAQRTRQKGKCFWCSCAVGPHYHVDHVTPLAKGGSNGPENIVVSCPSCNLAKKDKHPMDFAGVLL